MILIMAHEYTHHIQKEEGFFLDNVDYFYEGQARTVQRHISFKKQTDEGNSAYVLENLQSYDLPELQATYIWLSKNYGKTPIKSLCQDLTKTSDLKYLRNYNIPTKHAICNTFLLLMERKFGTGIHKEIMAGKYQLSF